MPLVRVVLLYKCYGAQADACWVHRREPRLVYNTRVEPSVMNVHI